MDSWTYYDVVICRDWSRGSDESLTTSFLDGQSLDMSEGDCLSAFRMQRLKKTRLLGHQRSFQMVREAHPPCALPFAIDRRGLIVSVIMMTGNETYRRRY